MTKFTIESLRPIGDDFWKAEFTTAATEVIEDRSFGQQTSITVRFKYHHDQSARGLIEHAIGEARRCLSSACADLQDRDIQTLASESEARQVVI